MADHSGPSRSFVAVNRPPVILTTTGCQDDIEIIPDHFIAAVTEGPFRGLVKKENPVIFVYSNEGLVGVFNRSFKDNELLVLVTGFRHFSYITACH